MADLLGLRWQWFWRTNEDGTEADCGIVAETIPGHAYAVVRCPRYMPEGQWTELASHICDTHNASLGLDVAPFVPLATARIDR